MASVYGIGNTLIDMHCAVEDGLLQSLDLTKGTMLLVDDRKRNQILQALEGKEINYHCGGSAPNTMITMRMLGMDTYIAGGVGKDKEGAIYRKKLSETGVVDDLVDYDAHTGTSIILISPDGERTMNTYLGANRLFDDVDVQIDHVSECGLFYFTGYMWDTAAQQRAVRRVLQYAKEHNIMVGFDLADPFAVGRYRSVFLDLISNYCDIIFANKGEARFLVDNYDPYECCRSMGKLCPVAVVKNGKLGSFVSDNGKIHTVPMIGSSSAVDTTGAGDTYAAGFLYGMLSGYGPEASGRIASYLSGEIISVVGAQFPEERAEELRRNSKAIAEKEILP